MKDYKKRLSRITVLKQNILANICRISKKEKKNVKLPTCKGITEKYSVWQLCPLSWAGSTYLSNRFVLEALDVQVSGDKYQETKDMFLCVETSIAIRDHGLDSSCETNGITYLK